ncbi:MAG: SGNH/GDSL hydrolase family protein [Muribaculaceae bacterium]|nr:SGNH/GDSL hydrolase family protein [Muribaculaceae bacterium]
MKFKLIIIVILYSCFYSQLIDAREGTKFYDASQFQILGKVYTDSLPVYSRIPDFKKDIMRQALINLGNNSAGIAIRFRSNSTSIWAKWTALYGNSMNHMTDTGVKGLDLYCYENNQWRFVRSGRPLVKETTTAIIENMESKDREYMLYLPLYDGVENLEIGIDSISYISSPRLQLPEIKNPIVFYGSSILQGGCASRPGMAATNIITRRLNIETINLGFSGNAFVDYEIAEMMADVDASAYVLDYVPNASPEQILEKTEEFVRILRSKHSSVPLIFIEDPEFTHAIFDKEMAKEIKDKNEAMNTMFNILKKKGVKNIYLIKGDKLLPEGGEATVDGIHCTDTGFEHYVGVLLPLLKKVIK